MCVYNVYVLTMHSSVSVQCILDAYDHPTNRPLALLYYILLEAQLAGFRVTVSRIAISIAAEEVV
jgi:hypothetical protein